MKKKRTLLILGLWIAILPYLGFPYAWKQVLFTISGLFVMYIAYLFYKKYKAENQPNKKPAPDNFSENTGFKGNKI